MKETRGPLDLTLRIEELEGKVKFLQETCRRAGATIKALEEDNKKLTNEVSDYINKIQLGPDDERKHGD